MVWPWLNNPMLVLPRGPWLLWGPWDPLQGRQRESLLSCGCGVFASGQLAEV